LQTISMLAYLHTYKNIAGPHLVVVPKSTLGNWMNEFRHWFPKLRVLKFYGSKDERALIKERDLQFGKFDVLATSYEVVIREKVGEACHSLRALCHDLAIVSVVSLWLGRVEQVFVGIPDHRRGPPHQERE
jgi:SNF2 family DNA or RNA helicase